MIQSMITPHIAVASDPVRFSQLTLSDRATQMIENWVQNKADQFLTYDVSKQVRILNRADRRYERMIHRMERWSEAKYERRIQFAQRVLEKHSLAEGSQPEAMQSETMVQESFRADEDVVSFSSEEQELYSTHGSMDMDRADQDALAVSTPVSAPLRQTQSKSDLIRQLRSNQESIRTLKSELLKQTSADHKLDRKIASSIALKVILTVVFALLLVAGVFAIIYGLAITVVSLGTLAPTGTALVVLGALAIAGALIAIPLFWTKM